MRILFVTNDHLGDQRAGPAIRCIELARVLARVHEVTIASSQPDTFQLDSVAIVTGVAAQPARLRALAVKADVLVAQGLVLARYPFLARLASHLVIDLYDPYLLEYIAHPHPRFASWGYLRQWHFVNQQLLRGDFFMCANGRQWDYWLGRLCALGRVTPAAFAQDFSFQRLLAVVPFGLSPQEPCHTQNALKGVVPGITHEDVVALWAGGIWQWLDPLTVVRSMSLLASTHPRVKLVFLGTQDPNPTNREMPMVASCRAMARDLGLLDRSVFFLPGWVPFSDRANYLLEADIGISAHLDTLESRFAFRTRVLDYIWAGLPMVLSRGDYFAELTEQRGLGATVGASDVQGWAEAIAVLSSDKQRYEQIRERLRQLAPELYWGTVAQPLIEYCQDPYHTVQAMRVAAKLLPVVAPLYEVATRWRK